MTRTATQSIGLTGGRGTMISMVSVSMLLAGCGVTPAGGQLLRQPKVASVSGELLSQQQGSDAQKRYPNLTPDEAKVFDELEQQVTKKTDEVTQRQDDLERERRRGQGLVEQLQRYQSVGCRQATPLVSIRIEVNGDHLDTFTYQNKKRKSGIVEKIEALEGGGESVLFDLGNRIYLSNSELNNELFQANGQLISHNYGTMTIGDITHIKVKKAGVSADFGWNRETRLGFFEWKRRTAEEKYRLHLNGLSIKVTDDKGVEHLLYQSDGVDHTFQFGSLDWEARKHFSLKRNAAYKRLMSEWNCQ